MARATLIATLALLSTAAAAEMTVSTDFEGGNAEVVTLDAAAARLRIMPALRNDRGWPCWWYLRLDGLTPGQEVTLEVQAQTRPYRESSVLDAAWCQPERAMISADDIHWTQTPPMTRGANKLAVYRFKAPAARVWAAWGPRFTMKDAEELLASVVEKVPAAMRFDLSATRDGRMVKGVRIGSEDAPFQAWVNARQHAWEAGGSWVGRGFIEWLASAEAAEFRERACVHFIPIMDVDNVTLGAGGKEAVPRDHNRDWSATPVYPEIAAAQKRIREIHAKRGLDVFLDLHNPGAGDKTPFFFGPFGFERLTGIQRRNYTRWMELAAASINGPLPVAPEYRFATYVKTDEERGRMSSGWVRANAGEHTISVTLETAWNNPASTPDGYRAVGRQLAASLAKYAAGSPRQAPAQ